jgi:hypothetical protein
LPKLFCIKLNKFSLIVSVLPLILTVLNFYFKVFVPSLTSNFSVNIPNGEVKNFSIIGSAHNQLEYFIKNRQGCSMIMLSPIFYNSKYSHNQILNPIRFNLITKNWKNKICALGGVNSKNIKLINLTKCNSIGIKSLITLQA